MRCDAMRCDVLFYYLGQGGLITAGVGVGLHLRHRRSADNHGISHCLCGAKQRLERNKQTKTHTRETGTRLRIGLAQHLDASRQGR